MYYLLLSSFNHAINRFGLLVYDYEFYVPLRNNGFFIFFIFQVFRLRATLEKWFSVALLTNKLCFSVHYC